jgi:hypothetical protein
MKKKPNRRERFVDLAEKRVTSTLKDIKLISNLSNKSNYEYSAEDVKKIFGALEKALKDAKSKFELGGNESDVVFKL